MSSRKRVGWTGEQMKEAVDAVNGGMKIKPEDLIKRLRLNVVKCCLLLVVYC